MTEARNGSTTSTDSTLYSHRFTKAQAAGLKAINDSLPVDRRMYEEDIIGSMAHARMLGKQGIIPADEARPPDSSGELTPYEAPGNWEWPRPRATGPCLAGRLGRGAPRSRFNRARRSRRRFIAKLTRVDGAHLSFRAD